MMSRKSAWIGACAVVFLGACNSGSNGHVNDTSTMMAGPIGDLPCGEDVWVSLIIRDGSLVTAGGDTALRAGDDVLVLADPDDVPVLDRLFSAGGGT